MTITAPPQPRALPVADPEDFRPDPHRGFRKYRPLSGVIDIGSQIPLIIRYRDVEALLTDPRTRQVETELLDMRGIQAGALHKFYAHSMLLSNPPDHERRRRPVARTFAHPLIQRWRSRIRAVALDMIGEVHQGREMEFVSTIAARLPARMIAEILGAPQADAPHFAEIVFRMSRGLGPFRPQDYPGIEAAAEELVAYVARLLADRRAEPQDDFLSDYLALIDENDALSEVETVIQIVTLIIAGSDTTRFGLTMALSLLLQHREQWEALTRDPDLAPGAVREALRYEPPVGSFVRVAAEPVEIAGYRFEGNTLLDLSFLSAQRDPEIYADPETFDIARTDHPRWSLTFGLGPHRCLGAALAVAEMEEVLSAIAETLPSLRPVNGPAEAKGISGIRGIGRFALTW